LRWDEATFGTGWMKARFLPPMSDSRRRFIKQASEGFIRVLSAAPLQDQGTTVGVPSLQLPHKGVWKIISVSGRSL